MGRELEGDYCESTFKPLQENPKVIGRETKEKLKKSKRTRE